jgi:hypothetical protein
LLINELKKIKYEDERDEETTKKNKKTTIYKDREKENGFS